MNNTPHPLRPQGNSFTLPLEVISQDWEKYDNYLDFRREQVWGLGKRRNFIDSVFHEYRVPELIVIFRGTKYVIIDGQQRFSTIRAFREDKFTTYKAKGDSPYSPIEPNKRYSELLPRWRETFDKALLTFCVIEDAEEWVLADYHRRVNCQQPLLLPEKIWTYPGEAKERAKDLLTHPFWQTIYSGSQKHRRPFLGCYYIMLIESSGEESDMNITDGRLRDFAAGLNDTLMPSTFVETIRRRLDIVNHVFYGTSVKDLIEVIPLYQAVHALESAGFDLVNSTRGCLTLWYKPIQDKALTQRQKYGITDDLLKMTRSRYRRVFWDQQTPYIIEVKGLRRRDEAKDYPQQINLQRAIERQGGKCPYCDKPIVKPYKGQYVIEYQKGSLLTVENCAIAHTECHEASLRSKPNGALEMMEITNED